jgi:PA14 domain
VRAVKWPDANLPVSRVDPAVDFAWGRDADPDLVGDRFTAQWTGFLLVPTHDTYEFGLSTTAHARLRIGTRTVASTLGKPVDGTLRAAAGRLELQPGAHLIVLETVEPLDRTGELHLSWAVRGGERHIVPRTALRTADGRPGLDAEYVQHIPPLSGLGRTGGREDLRRLGIRYVVTADADNPCVQHELELPERYRGEGIRVYTVPEPDA